MVAEKSSVLSGGRTPGRDEHRGHTGSRLRSSRIGGGAARRRARERGERERERERGIGRGKRRRRKREEDKGGYSPVRWSTDSSRRRDRPPPPPFLSPPRSLSISTRWGSPVKEGQRSIVEYEGRDLTHTRDEPRVRHGSSSGKVEEPWLEETETKGGEKEREREGGREKERERGRERENRLRWISSENR